jgi:redox-sensitive bicupin YhaK (pirin superfamily)
MIIFDNDGQGVLVSAPADAAATNTTSNKSALEILLIGEVRLNESVARYCPFVMNSKEEILKAVENYQNG